MASPVDLIPEFLPVIGPLDDVVVVALALRYAGRQVPPRSPDGRLARRTPTHRTTPRRLVPPEPAGALGLNESRSCRARPPRVGAARRRTAKSSPTSSPTSLSDRLRKPRILIRSTRNHNGSWQGRRPTPAAANHDHCLPRTRAFDSSTPGTDSPTAVGRRPCRVPANSLFPL
ncbi:YkvA family protein [Salinispora arenicola]|uniref:YkvA family protein n=1 Tax=Salinispora arenicola TaxID=168697 RepID=UPI0027DD215F|nr:YkvA family protein [Salinispora arenicola]